MEELTRWKRAPWEPLPASRWEQVLTGAGGGRGDPGEGVRSALELDMKIKCWYLDSGKVSAGDRWCH